MPSLIVPVYQTLNSSELPPQERYAHWLVPLLSDFQAASPDTHQRLDFVGNVTSLMTATGELHDMCSDDFEGAITPRKPRHDSSDKLALIYVTQGHVLGRYEDTADTVTKAGEFLLFDARKPTRLRFCQPRFIQINLPRRRLQHLLNTHGASEALNRALSRSGLADLLRSQLAQFRGLSSGLSPEERLAFLQCTEDLASLVLESTYFNTRLPETDRLDGLYVAAKHYIDSNLGGHLLNGACIAAALGCSRSSLYRAFARHGLRLAEYIREQRLQRLAQLLQRSGVEPSIAQLAASCGLYDAPNLSRLFRRRFGESPKDFRARQRSLGSYPHE